jgi:hypothetical protein
MQSAHFRECDYCALIGELHRPPCWAIHAQQQVRPPPVVILEVAGEDASEAVLAEDDHRVQALSPDAPDFALRRGILPGTLSRSQEVLAVQVRDASLKPFAVESVTTRSRN